MKYNRFEDLPVWNAAVDLKLDIDELCEQRCIARRRNWIDQIDRASLSISNNIAEGFERGSDADFANFLRIAKGSCGEVRSMFYTAEDLGYAASPLAAERREKLKQLAAGIEALRTHLKA